jgi:hypothetical protein
VMPSVQRQDSVTYNFDRKQPHDVSPGSHG